MYQYMHAVDFTCYLLETDILLFVGSLGSQTKESPIINVELYGINFLPLCLLTMGVK